MKTVEGHSAAFQRSRTTPISPQPDHKAPRHPKQNGRQHAVVASDAEWQRISRVARSADMEISRFIVHLPLIAGSD